MLTSHQRDELDGLAAQARATAAHVKARFGPLTAAQLNWKPAPDRWSVGQCLEHLVTSDRSYFPTFETVRQGRYRKTLWQHMPGLPGFFGRMLLKTIDPANTRKSKAPAVFQPASSEVGPEIVRGFLDQHAQLVEYLQAGAGLDLDGTIIASPVSPIVTYSLFDAFRILVRHAQRHVQQADRVVALDAFPR
jgi:DinB family protein